MIAKIIKPGGSEPDQFETEIGQALLELELNSELKPQLRDLHITRAREVEVVSNKKVCSNNQGFVLRSRHPRDASVLYRSCVPCLRSNPSLQSSKGAYSQFASDLLTFVSIRMLFVRADRVRPGTNKNQPINLSCHTNTALVFLAYEIILVCNRQEELTVKHTILFGVSQMHANVHC